MFKFKRGPLFGIIKAFEKGIGVLFLDDKEQQDLFTLEDYRYSMYYVYTFKFEELKEFLKPYKRLDTTVNNHDQTLLHILLLFNLDLDIISHIVEKDPTIVKIKDVFGASALHYALEVGNQDKIEYLLSKGADIFTRNNDLDSMLHISTYYENREYIAFCLAKGIDIESKDIKGRTPICWSVTIGDVKTMKYLLSKGADINVKNNKGNNLLHIACKNEKIKMIK